MNKNKLIVAISLFILTTISVRPAFADGAVLPDFGSCLNPQGDVIASYENGKHGIVGKTKEVIGSDSVYKSSSNGVTQCFCPINGDGIQTNWYKVSNVSPKDINVLKSQGWTYIVNGSSWGLEDAPYLAKNSKFACKGSSTTYNTENVLGLASTGDGETIYALILSGAAFLISGIILRRFSK